MSLTRSFPLMPAVVALAALSGGCGGEDPQPSAERQPAAVRQVSEMPDKPPHSITCADLADRERSARMSRRATNALASKAEIKGLTQLQAAQSIFFAMTELCKSEEAGYRPAVDAVKAVRAGDYRADLGTP